MLETTRLDIAEMLDTEQDIAEFLAESANGTPDEFIHALGIAARAKGMTDIARQAGVTRASLYKSLSLGANPEFATVAKVCGALGLKLVPQVALD